MPALLAGAAVADITPTSPVFLFGYPHTPRTSTGVNDHLLSVAVAIEQAGQACILIANDVIFVSRPSTRRVRASITAAAGVPGDRILVAASHTHSGPVTLDYLSNEQDPVVPRVDPAYLKHLESGITRAAIDAWQSRRPAEIGYARADATGIGSNRHDPAGPSDLSVPVLSVRDAATHRPIALLLSCAMHPTVLHGDSTLLSGDFPAYARKYLQRHVADCPVAYFMGASGDQSPRHVTRAKTFAEAERLGGILGLAVARSLAGVRHATDLPVAGRTAYLDLPRRTPPNAADAERQLFAARQRLDRLRAAGAPATEVRTAECDWFGAEETVSIARAAAQGRLEAALADCLPAEIQVLAIGPHRLVGWPGEFFVEFALAVRQGYPDAAIITCANGDLQGYVVTQQAVDQNRYEAGNALLKSPDAGNIVVEQTIALLKQIGHSVSPSPRRTPDTLLVFDFGTTYFKAGVVDRSGAIVALHRQASPIDRRDGRSQIAPDALDAALRDACTALRPHLAGVAGVTFSSQANTFTLLDADQRPLMPLIVWDDPRGSEVDAACRDFADAAFTQASGLPTLNRAFTLGRLAWLQQAGLMPAGARRVQWLADRVVARLTGQPVTEAGLAALTGLFDVPQWRWSASACRFASIDPAMLPAVVRAGTAIGEVLPPVAAELGLPPGCRMIAGCLDQYAGALGVGNDRPGRVSETTGTVLATIACSPSWETGQTDEIYRGPGASAEQFFHMSFGNVSANLLEHYRNLRPDLPEFETLSAEVTLTRRLHLDERRPVDELKALIATWAPAEPPPEVVGAIFAAVARSLAGHVRRIAPTTPSGIFSAGGAARSRQWLQIKADTLGVPFVAPAVAEPTLLGAATLAGSALGWPPLASVTQPPDASRTVVPARVRS